MTSHHAPISSCMIVLDHSQSMLKDDYAPTRFEFQQQASSYIVDCILEEALTSKSGSGQIPQIGVMVGTDVLIGPQEDTAIVYEALADNLALATTDLTTSLRVASLAMRKYEKETQQNDEKEQLENDTRKVIIAFVGSPLNGEDDDDLNHVGRILKRNATEIIIIALGDDTDDKSLQELVSVADGKVVKISPQKTETIEALDGLFCSSSHTPAPETTDALDGHPMNREHNDNATSHRIDALLDRSREERGKIELMLKTSFSSEVIPPPPGRNNKDILAQGCVDSNFDDDANPVDTTDDNRDDDDDDDDDTLPSPASSERGQWSEEEPYDERESQSQLLQVLDCGPEIIPMQPSNTTRQMPQLTIQVNNSTDEEDMYDHDHDDDLHNRDQVKLERHISMSPTSGGTDLRQEQENIARFANLRQTHVSVADYERVKTELRAAKRYIRVLQRLVKEKDEMIGALHVMVGCLRSQIYDSETGEKSEVTTLILDGGDITEHKDGTAVGNNTSSPWDDLDDNMLKPSLSSDSHISINEIRKRTRELEALHASLANKSKALETMALNRSKKSQTLTEKRNKKRELEALRASITAN